MPRKSQAQKWLELGNQFRAKGQNAPTQPSMSDAATDAFQEHITKEIKESIKQKRKSKSNPKNLIKNLSAVDLRPVYLPNDLVLTARQKLSERNIELETFLQIYLRMILRASKGILGLQDEFGFGKYRGEKVEEIVKIDPSYVAWLITQDGRTKFEPEVLVLVNEMITK